MFIQTWSHFLRTVSSPQPHRGASQQKRCETVVGAAGEQTPLLVCGAGIQWLHFLV